MYFIVMAIAVFGWLFPMKIRLIKKYGPDKNNAFFVRLAKEGNPEAKRLVSGSRKLLIFGVIGAIIISFRKFI